MHKLLSTKELATFLGINEKKVYSLIAEEGLPATKVTGKWLFPSHLVEQWVESRTINFPSRVLEPGSMPDELLIIAGSNDILFDRTLPLFSEIHPDRLAVFGNLGSMGGLKALRKGLCHMATSHLAQENEQDFNFSYAQKELAETPAVVNFCLREQGILVARNIPKKITNIRDIVEKGLRLVNRPPGTGTRLLLDRSLHKLGFDGSAIPGYEREVQRHLDVGLEILAGRADAGPAIRPVASLLNLDFLPLTWERFDLIIPKSVFFHETIQGFLNIFHEERFQNMASELQGYDIRLGGKIVYPVTS
ncbi:MAG: substrate-binding domain-containing protein [Desulfovibrionales bacterium]